MGLLVNPCWRDGILITSKIFLVVKGGYVGSVGLPSAVG